MSFQEFLDTAKSIAKESGTFARTESEKYRNQQAVLSKLCSSDLVTETDRKVEAMIRDGLAKKYPTHKFIGEETAEGPCVFTDEPTWIVDPIDGTTNYVHGFPFSAVCIALAINKEVVVGVVYNLFLDQLFSAYKGGGAFLNDKSIHVSNCKDVKKALVIADVGGTRTAPELEPKVSTIHDLASEACHVHGIGVCPTKLSSTQHLVVSPIDPQEEESIRTLGSAAINSCMVAQGCIDAYIEYGVHCWDYAAGDIIVREAGGVSLYPTGGPLDLMGRGVLFASSKELAEAMVPFIHHCNYPRDD